MSVKDLAKQALPHAICEYSIRRHEYMRLGLGTYRASRIALSSRRYRGLIESRLNLLPKNILCQLRTCVDAGAHAGTWTQALLDFFQPQRVIDVECDPRMVGPLKALFRDCGRVNVVDAALAKSEGETVFYQLRHPAGSSLLKPRDEIKKELLATSWDLVGEVDVQKISYDQLIADEEEISILKIDIQGAEMGVLKASQEGLRKTKSIIMEVTFLSHYENDSGFPELHQLMASKGFGLYNLSAPYARGGRILYADAVYVREEILADLAPQ
ncbi:MAG: FkbM family methyltransferase [Candidatus Sulfotelmatobacter sp.]